MGLSRLCCNLNQMKSKKSQPEQQPNSLAQTILSRVHQTESTLSPWVWRALQDGFQWQSRFIGQRSTAITTANTLTVVGRVQRFGTHSTVWDANRISIAPDMVERFADEISGHFYLKPIAVQQSPEIAETTWEQAPDILPLAGSFGSPDFARQSTPAMQTASRPTSSSTSSISRQVETPAPAPPHFMTKKQDRRPSWLPKRKEQTQSGKPSIEIAGQNQPASPQQSKVQPSPENLRLFSKVEYESDMGKTPAAAKPPGGRTPPEEPDQDSPQPAKKILPAAIDKVDAPSEAADPQPSSFTEPDLQAPSFKEPEPAPHTASSSVDPVEEFDTIQSASSSVAASKPTSRVDSAEKKVAPQKKSGLTRAAKKETIGPSASVQPRRDKIEPAVTPQQEILQPQTDQSEQIPAIDEFGQIEVEDRYLSPTVDDDQQTVVVAPPSQKSDRGQDAPMVQRQVDSGVPVQPAPSPKQEQPPKSIDTLPKVEPPGLLGLRQDRPTPPEPSRSSRPPPAQKVTPRPDSEGADVNLGKRILERIGTGRQILLTRPSPSESRKVERPRLTTAKQARTHLVNRGWRFKKRESGETSATPQQISRAVDDLERSADQGGQPLPAEPRSVTEQALGRDFSSVRVQTAQLAPLNVEAATRGTDIYVEPDQTHFETPQSMAVLGHELTHVTQRGLVQSKPVVETAVLPQVRFEQEPAELQREEGEATRNEERILRQLKPQPDISTLSTPAQPPTYKSASTPTVMTKKETTSSGAARESDAIPGPTADWLAAEVLEQRQPLVSPAASNTIFRQAESEPDTSDTSETDEGDQEGEETTQQEPDLDDLARQIYPIIKRMLSVERERRPGHTDFGFR